MEAWIRANPQHERDLRGLLNSLKGFIIGIGEKAPPKFGNLASKYQEMMEENLIQFVNSMGLSHQNLQFFMIEQGICNLAKSYEGQYIFVPVRNAETKNILDMKSRDKVTKQRKIAYQFVRGNPFPAPGSGGSAGRQPAFGSGAMPSSSQPAFVKQQRNPLKMSSRPQMQKSGGYIKGANSYQSGGAGIFNPLTGQVEYKSTPAPAARVPTPPQFDNINTFQKVSHQEDRPQNISPPKTTVPESRARVPPVSYRSPQETHNQSNNGRTQNATKSASRNARVPPLHPNGQIQKKPAAGNKDQNEPADPTSTNTESIKELKRKEEIENFNKKLLHIVSRYPKGLTMEELATKFKHKHSSQLKATLGIIDRKSDDPIKILRKHADEFRVYVSGDELVYPIQYSPSKWKKTVYDQISDILGVLDEPEDIEEIKQDFENRHPISYESYGFRSFYEFLMYLDDIAVMEVENGSVKLGKNYISTKQNVTQFVTQLVYNTEREGRDLQIRDLRKKFRKEFCWDLPMNCFTREFEENVDIHRLAYLVVNNEHKKNVLRIENDCLKLKSKAELRSGLSRLRMAAPLLTRFTTWTKPSFSEKFYVSMLGEVFSVDEIWVQRGSDYKDSMGLIGEMTEFYGNNDENTDRVENDILPGCSIAIYDEPHWLRGEVIDMIEDGVLVRYVDFGSVEAVPSSRIRWLDEKFINHPKYAFPVSLLSDVNPEMINESVINQLNDLVSPLLENLEDKDAQYIFECRSVDICGYQGFKGRIKVKTDDSEFDLLSYLLQLYKVKNPEETPSENGPISRRDESFSPRIPENLEDDEISSEESAITVSSVSLTESAESSVEHNQPAEEEPQDLEDETSTKEGEFDVNIVYPPEDVDVNTGLYITEHNTHLDINGKKEKFINLVLMNINTEQLAISFETLNNLFIQFLTGFPRIKARVWLKKVALKGILNLDPLSIKEKFGDKITENDSERFSSELESWGLTGVHPDGKVQPSEGKFTFILWNDLWKAYCKAKKATPPQPFIGNKGIDTVFEAFRRTSAEVFDGDV